MKIAENSEAKIIALILADPKQSLLRCADGTHGVSSELFLNPRYRWMFEQITRLDHHGKSIDFATLRDIAHKEGAACPATQRDFDDLMSAGYIADSTETGWRTAVELMQERKVSHIVASAAEEPGDTIANMQAALKDAYAITSPHALTIPADKAAEEWLREWHRVRKEGIASGMTTGYAELDQTCGGMRPGQLWTIGGKPGMGKTALMLQWSLHVAKNYGTVWFGSYEMMIGEIVTRAVSLLGQVDMDAATNPTRVEGRAQIERDANLACIEVGAQKLANRPILFRDQVPPSIDSFCAAARRECELRGNVKMITVDYLQRIPYGRSGKASRATEVDYIAASLKRLARETETVVLTGTQLNQDGGTRESEGVWNESDALLNLMRFHGPEQNATTEQPRLQGLWVKKLRNGPAGSRFGYIFNPVYQQFQHCDQTHDDLAAAQTKFNR